MWEGIVFAWNWLVETAGGWSMLSMFIRLLSALCVGVLIGIDRERKRRGAGVKTHALVCLGAAVVMMTSQYMFNRFPGASDLGRMGAQVISGVGFLGVGTIIVTGKNKVRGLTTAAGLWACACIGLAAGIGYIEGVILCVLFVMFTFKVLNTVDMQLQKHSKYFHLYLEFANNQGVAKFLEAIRKESMRLANFELSKSQNVDEGPTAIVGIEVNDKAKAQRLLEILRSIEGLTFVEEL